MAETLRDSDHQLVAERVAETVVDHLEVVEVDEQHRDHAVAIAAGAERDRHPFGEGRAVGQPRHRVVRGLVGEPVGQRLAVGDVFELADLVDRVAFHVSHHRDAQRCPHHRSVGPQVALLVAVRVDLAASESLPVLLGGSAVVGVGQVEDLDPDELLLRASEQHGHRPVGALDPAAHVDEADADRRVVEGMAEGLLGLVERCLLRLALGDVPQVGDPAFHARITGQVGHDHVEPAPRALAVPQAGFIAAAARVFGDRGAHSLHIGGMDEIEPHHADGLLRGVSEESLEGRAHVAHDRVGPDHHDDVAGVLHQCAESLLALAQLRFALAQLGLRGVGLDHRALEELDREREAERGEHGQAVHERLIDQRRRDPERDRELAQADTRDAQHDGGSDRANPRESDALHRAEDQPDGERGAPSDGVHHRGDAEHVNRDANPYPGLGVTLLRQHGGHRREEVRSAE